MLPIQNIAHYRVTGKLGEGGMGAVYRATDTKLNREVAIKVLPDEFAADPDRMARFTREAQVLASLNHPNIATIYGIEDRAIVMELVEGEDLSGPLPLNTALNYAGQIADALEAAHEKGITHRDLKPANIKITPQGVVKVLDFGLAKIGDAPSAKPGPTATTRTSTQPGMVMGTAGYMAPEQARGQQVDKRADIWAFGVVLWEMLTGKQLFGGATGSDAIAAVLTKEPDLEVAPAKVRRLLARCLEKDPRKRLRDIGDWRDLLEESQPRQSKSRFPWIIAAGLLAVGLAIALWRTTRPAGTVDRPLVQLDLDAGGDVSSPAISADGTRLAFVVNNQIAVRRLDQTKITRLAGTEGASYPFFSPDGQWIAFIAGGKLQKISVEGAALVTLCDAPRGETGSWGSDGSIIVRLRNGNGLFKVPAAGGIPQPFTDLAGEPGVTQHRLPQVLPDRKGVLFESFGMGDGDGIRVMPPGGGKPRVLVTNASCARYIADGRLAYWQRGTVFAVPFDVDRLEIMGLAVPLVEAVGFLERRPAYDVSLSGTLVYRRGPREGSRIVAWLDSSGTLTPILAQPDGYLSPRLSPDGNKLAFGIERKGLWVYDFASRTKTRVALDTGNQDFATWTPDAKFLAFRSGTSLSVVRTDGSGKPERSDMGDGRPRSFSPDGKWLVFYQPSDHGRFQLWAAPAGRDQGTLRFGQPRQLLQQEGMQFAPAVSPDSRWLAYHSDETGRTELYVRPFSPEGTAKGGGLQVSTDGGMEGMWSSRAQELFFHGTNDGRLMAVSYSVKGDAFVQSLPRIWSERRLVVSGFASFDVAPDGKRVVGIFDADEGKPETSLHILLNAGR